MNHCGGVPEVLRELGGRLGARRRAEFSRDKNLTLARKRYGHYKDGPGGRKSGGGGAPPPVSGNARQCRRRTPEGRRGYGDRQTVPEDARTGGEHQTVAENTRQYPRTPGRRMTRP